MGGAAQAEDRRAHARLDSDERYAEPAAHRDPRVADRPAAEVIEDGPPLRNGLSATSAEAVSLRPVCWACVRFNCPVWLRGE